MLEMLIVVSILGVILVMSAPSFMRLRMSEQANQAVATLRAIQNAEAYYLQIYHKWLRNPRGACWNRNCRTRNVRCSFTSRGSTGANSN